MLLAAAALTALASVASAAGPQLTPAQREATHAMFEHVIDTPTVIGRHNVPAMAKYVADQFTAAGFPASDVHVLPYHTASATTGEDDTAALIVRWRAAGAPKAKPILLLGHMDVVEAKPEDWSVTDPFKMIEKDGYYYGRGTIDMKEGIVAITQAMINLQKAGFRPKRDIVLLFTGDEETNGIGARKGAGEWIDLLGHPEFGLNADGIGGGRNADGSPAGMTFQSAEKTFAGYTFTVRNRGGHSSKPR
jgi:acetylornithine deacetylase/succinyl-diaminopimelate desuccinylase-like protein